MKKLGLILAGAAMVATTPFAFTSPASADPSAEVWRCWQNRDNTVTIPQSKYYTCVGGQVHIVRVSDQYIVLKMDGNCLNQVWQANRSTTPWEAREKCKHGGATPR